MSFSLVLLAASVVMSVRFAYMVVRAGHAAALTDALVLSIVSVLVVVLAPLEVVRVSLWPVRAACRRACGGASKAKSPPRRVVVFDGVCVLCNTFGSFVVRRLTDPTQVNFIPFQDPGSNPHVSLPRLLEEFSFGEAELQDRIAVVSGDRLLWGSDAVLEILGWCVWPYPLLKGALWLPHPVRDAMYLTVARNRYRWFGTQPLDKNFAKSLCPYYWFKGIPTAGKDKAT